MAGVVKFIASKFWHRNFGKLIIRRIPRACVTTIKYIMCTIYDWKCVEHVAMHTCI